MTQTRQKSPSQLQKSSHPVVLPPRLDQNVPIPATTRSGRRTLQQTIQALSTLVQQISLMNFSDPTLLPNTAGKNKIKKSKIKAILESLLDEDD
ncbi:hypothetical protein TNCV_892361 [Trichonephila clavipes]|nr:hypothetical protein TNCV_892361 [Trichonephila clavipes]